MSRPAQRAGFVTGGSSGIGLAAARILARRGQNVAVFARDEVRLAAAVAILEGNVPTGTLVRGYRCDVSDRKLLFNAVQSALAELGPPSHAIAAAGIVVPGLFADQEPAMRDRHMAVNYFGAADFVRALVPAMAETGGRIGLMSSALAYVGIYGYSAYAPSKHALRALSEILNLELAPLGITVTHIAPPDTNTPMLAEEARTKPRATARITAAGGLWQPEAVAARAVAAMDRGLANAPIGVQTRALAYLSGLMSPALRAWQRQVIRKHGRH